jgi:hypothetical protein
MKFDLISLIKNNWTSNFNSFWLYFKYDFISFVRNIIISDGKIVKFSTEIQTDLIMLTHEKRWKIYFYAERLYFNILFNSSDFNKLLT